MATIEIEKAFQIDKHTVWDMAVPIVKKGNTTKVYITSDIDTPDMYNELCFRLTTATAKEKFEIYINTPGGIVDSAFMICDAIKRSKAKVVADLSGTVASAGTIIAMACDDVRVSEHLSFMVHNYSGGMTGKGHEMKARQEFMDASLNSAFKSFYRGFLSDDEMQEIIDGKDLWIGSEEVIERWSAKADARKTEKRGRKKASA